MDVVVQFVSTDGSADPPAATPTTAGRFDRLPEPIHLEDTITSVDTVPHSGPELQRDPQIEFMLRYAMP